MELSLAWAGNAETEYLLEDPKIGKFKDLSSIFSLVVNFFDPLKKIHGWGASIPYYLGAKLGLHPTYVQELCAMKDLNKTSMHHILSDLGEIDTPQSFCPATLKRVIAKKKNSAKVDGCKVDSRMEGREIVLVAQTGSSAKYREAILDYVVAKNAILVSINQPKIVSDLPYDYVVVSHNEKFREDQENYLDKKFRYIGPKKLFPNTDINIVYDYGCVVTPGNFESFDSYASIPHNLTLAYMISFCLAARIGRVSLVGFSGYDKDFAKQKEMQEFLLLLGDATLPIQSLTPTSFTIPERSIYAL
jgi:4-hydroxy 2-oxovalerate aldolase